MQACPTADADNFYQTRGVRGCNIDQAAAGTYIINYTVTVGALTSWVIRTITVEASCPPGEVLCADKVTCSDGGTCASDLASTAVVFVDAVNFTIALKNNDFLSRNLEIKQFTNYTRCVNGNVPTKELACELGAEAMHSREGNITSKVRPPV